MKTTGENPTADSNADIKAKGLPSTETPESPDQSKDGDTEDQEMAVGGIYKDDAIFANYGEPFVLNESDRLVLNHRAVTAKFAEEFSVTYDAETNEFYQYNEGTGVWQLLPGHALKRELGDFLLKLGQEFKRIELPRQTSAAQLNSLVAMLTSYNLGLQQQRVNGLVHVSNGVVDLRGETVKFEKHDRTYGFRAGSHISFDPAAKSEKFQGKLLESALKTEDISLLQRYFGSTLLGPNLAHGILLLRGNAGSGKSTLVSILEHILGLSRVAYLRTQHLAGRFEFSGFLNKRLLVGKDVPSDTLSLSGAKFLKSLAGGDLLEAEIKYNAAKPRLRGDFHVVISCNSRLRIALDEDDSAWKRRLLIVDFKKPAPTEPIPNFAEKLLHEEGPGILNWLIKGAMEHKKEMQEHGHYQLSTGQKRLVEALINGSDNLVQFISDRIVVKKGAELSVNELALDYTIHCQKLGWQPLTHAQFCKDLPDLMLNSFRAIRRNDIVREGKAVRGYKNVTFK